MSTCSLRSSLKILLVYYDLLHQEASLVLVEFNLSRKLASSRINSINAGDVLLSQRPGNKSENLTPLFN